VGFYTPRNRGKQARSLATGPSQPARSPQARGTLSGTIKGNRRSSR